ncbi:MAG: glucuronate isomerase [Erysipelotrichaceae bacterium]|nr:glucuronate isomerase [Erysipelotrichaceae bacterium]
MNHFINENFLLNSDIARSLYTHVENLPIIDYHCHISPKEIAENRQFTNMTQLWLGGDHYKWRVMRANGINEDAITGNVDDLVKFKMWAKTLPRCIGNPLYHWSHLELKRYFDIDDILKEDSAETIYKLCNEKLSNEEFRVRNLIKKSNVEILCTTDDPIDDLHYHKMIKADPSISFHVFPTFRPDKAINIEKDDYLSYLVELETSSNILINDFSSLLKALKQRIDYFHANGCRLSDHAFEYMIYEPYIEEDVDDIFKRRLNNSFLDEKDNRKFKTALLIKLATMIYEKDWVMQLHIGSRRNNNSSMYEKLGPDTGYDVINNNISSQDLIRLLDSLHSQEILPKTIVYSLNPYDNPVLTTIINSFQNDKVKMKLQHGTAWWFNDHKQGLIDQLTNLANTSVLGNFIGMATDSRSFISYPRHEYFRRILCDLIGNWVVLNEYPNDMEMLKSLVADISYYNAKNYFNFDI